MNTRDGEGARDKNKDINTKCYCQYNIYIVRIQSVCIKIIYKVNMNVRETKRDTTSIVSV